jgi:hypothetical protein
MYFFKNRMHKKYILKVATVERTNVKRITVNVSKEVPSVQKNVVVMIVIIKTSHVQTIIRLVVKKSKEFYDRFIY